MKKMIAMLLVLTMIAAVFAGCGNNTPAETTEATEAVAVPGSALEILENVWALYGEDEKFPVYGGNAKENYEDNTLGAPDNYDMSDLEMLSFALLAPYDLMGSVDQAASMTHEMMSNNFTAAVLHVNADVDQFAESYYNNVLNNQWLCGMPEKVIVAVIGGEYVLMAYGIHDAIDPFESKLLEAYPDAEVKYSESLV